MEYHAFTLGRPSALARRLYRGRVVLLASLLVNVALCMVLVGKLAGVSKPSSGRADLGFGWFGNGDNANSNAAVASAGASGAGLAMVGGGSQANVPQTPTVQPDASTNMAVSGAEPMATTPVTQPAVAQPAPTVIQQQPVIVPQPMFSPFGFHSMFMPSWPTLILQSLLSFPHMIGGMFHRGGGYHREVHHHHHHHHNQHHNQHHSQHHGAREPVTVGHSYGGASAKTHEKEMAMSHGHSTASAGGHHTTQHSSGHHQSHHGHHGGSRRRH